MSTGSREDSSKHVISGGNESAAASHEAAHVIAEAFGFQ